jgi:hypothetical protein
MVLAFSILISLKTVLLSNLNLIKIEKEDFLPSTGKILLLLSTVLFTVGRVGSFLIYFGPALGQFDLLHHWKKEQLKYKTKEDGGPYEKGGNLTTHNVTIPWSDIERHSPNYTIYTGLGLMWLYAIIIVTMVVHVAVVYKWKDYCSSHFR